MVLVPLELREETEGGLLGGTAIKWSPIVLTLRKYIACKRGLVGDWRGGGEGKGGRGCSSTFCGAAPYTTPVVYCSVSVISTLVLKPLFNLSLQRTHTAGNNCVS